MSEYIVVNGELYHYGVLGMKWGVHRARRKYEQNKKLQRKAFTYDKRSANMRRKSEKAHNKYDLEEANNLAVRAAKLDKKAASLSKKALKNTDEYTRYKLEKRSEKLKYKASLARLDSTQISKSEGYGETAMKYSIKADEMAVKAAKARKKIANNKSYIAMMNRKISSLTPEELEDAYSFCKTLKIE